MSDTRLRDGFPDIQGGREVRYEAASRDYDRAVGAFYHTYDLVNIALILANALLGFIFLATGEAGIAGLLKDARGLDVRIQPWVISLLMISIILLLIAILCLIYLTLKRPRFVIAVAESDETDPQKMQHVSEIPDPLVFPTKERVIARETERYYMLAKCYRGAANERTTKIWIPFVMIGVAIICYAIARLMVAFFVRS